MQSIKLLTRTAAEPFDACVDPRLSPLPTARKVPSPARQILTLFLRGARMPSDVSRSQVACVLRDLAVSLTGLASTPWSQTLIRFYEDPWELCVERIGPATLLSVYRSGEDPHVAILNQPAGFGDLIAATSEAIAELRRSVDASSVVTVELDVAAAALTRIDPALVNTDASTPPPTPILIKLDREAPLAIAADFAFRPRPPVPGEQGVERADLHALLFRGNGRVQVRGRVFELGEVSPFLMAERFLDIARQALDAWERGQDLLVRSTRSTHWIGVKISPNGSASLSLSASTPTLNERSQHTFPSFKILDIVEASLAFGRALVRAVIRRDRGQGDNLRLSAFRRALRETNTKLRDVCREDAKVNPSPEPYRTYAENTRSVPSTTAPLPLTRLRYTQRWQVVIPGIDLRATFLCGDRIIAGTASETLCVDRTTGKTLWRVDTDRAVSVVTPEGIARLHPDGVLAIHDFECGDVILRTKVAPREGGPPAGAVVHLPGLPRWLIVTEGARHLVAIDLTSGEAQWRFAWGGRGAVRLKRAGKLLYVIGGDSALTALDVLTGAVVWRVRDRLRFRGPVVVDHDRLYAVAGGDHCAANLYALDAFSGHTEWVRPLGTSSSSCYVEGPPLVADSVVVVPLQDRGGVRFEAFDRATGDVRWTHSSPLAPSGASWLAIDDLVIGNTQTGELLGIEGDTGRLRYEHALGRTADADVPRRLEPVLRSGALFVPHADVHVFRPRDGTRIATITSENLIPDLLRVDERCDVYIAEESGHLTSFGIGSRLSLVRNDRGGAE